LATLMDVNNNKYSPVLGQSYAPFSFRGSLRQIYRMTPKNIPRNLVRLSL
jgi:hypothetical protein